MNSISNHVCVPTFAAAPKSIRIMSCIDPTRLVYEYTAPTGHIQACLRDAVESAVARQIDLSGADLRGADLQDADLFFGTFIGADLSDATLTGADVSLCNFQGATLNGADFSHATLCGADVSDAHMDLADFSYADLTFFMRGSAFTWT